MNPTRNSTPADPARNAPAPASAPPNGTAADGDRPGAAPVPEARRHKARLLFEAVAKPFDGVARPVWNCLPRRWRSRLWVGAVLAAMFAAHFAATAQDPPPGFPPDGPPGGPPGGPPDAEEFLRNQEFTQTNDLNRAGNRGQPGDLAPANGLVETNRVVPTNGLPPAAPPSGSPPKADQAGASAPASGAVPEAPPPADDRASTNGPSATASGPARLDYAAFKIIADQNIFDPNRMPHRPGGGPRTKPKVTESFALVGTLSYEKGNFAFFDGTSSEYQKALKPAETIAGYTVATVAPSAVKLAAGTNTIELRIGMQLRREDGGDWLLATQSETYAASAPSNTTAGATPETAAAQTGASSGGDLSEIEKRMMQRREQQ